MVLNVKSYLRKQAHVIFMLPSQMVIRCTDGFHV